MNKDTLEIKGSYTVKPKKKPKKMKPKKWQIEQWESKPKNKEEEKEKKGGFNTGYKLDNKINL